MTHQYCPRSLVRRFLRSSHLRSCVCLTLQESCWSVLHDLIQPQLPTNPHWAPWYLCWRSPGLADGTWKQTNPASGWSANHGPWRRWHSFSKFFQSSATVWKSFCSALAFLALTLSVGSAYPAGGESRDQGSLQPSSFQALQACLKSLLSGARTFLWMLPWADFWTKSSMLPLHGLSTRASRQT